jgi:hypothetical protein
VSLTKDDDPVGGLLQAAVEAVLAVRADGASGHQELNRVYVLYNME